MSKIYNLSYYTYILIVQYILKKIKYLNVFLYNMRDLRITFIDVKLILPFRAKQSARKIINSIIFSCTLST